MAFDLSGKAVRATSETAARDLAGRRFGSWLVEGACRDAKGRAAWLCHCDCGVVRAVAGHNLLSGGSAGCGHIRRTQTRHPSGLKVRLHRIWRAMLMRCDPEGTYKDHAHYRKHGIRVCEAWRDYDTFADWATANGYRDDLTIDRRDNELGYSPENCRWADDETQMWNKRGLLRISIGGRQVLFARAVRDAGLDYTKAYTLLRKGLPFEEILARARNTGRAL